MSKDPAFLFYPNDWIGGTMGMTLEEKGAYIELLMMQFNRGHMTSHMIGLIVGQLWDKVKDKFEVDDKGLYFNRRLDEESEKRKRFTESRRNNKTGKNQYSNPSNNLGHTTSHMEDVNENDNINRDLNVKETINGVDFDYKSELTNYIKHLQENHDRSIGHMQVEQMIKMLDSWYTTKNQKSLCLSANIAGNWKTLNFVEVQTESEKIDYNQGAL